MKKAVLPHSATKTSKIAGKATLYQDKTRHYLCIDLKSFYAAVECVERGLDPMTTDLVVADERRTRGTICLAVSPSLKEKGVKNRCRLFEIPDRLLQKTIVAPPRMQKYIDYSARIYGLYLEYFSRDDIHVYSVDECFIDVTSYLTLYHKTARELAEFLMNEISEKIGVRAAAGIGTNLYLAKIALDITAKHATDFIGELDEKLYRKTLWHHRPLTDFWRIGPGISKRLEKHCLYTMADVAHADEDVLYDIFGKDAELLIDHAWGREPVTIADIKNYQSKETSFSSGQVLPRDYNYEETALVVREMMRDLCLRLVKEGKVATSVTLSLGLARNELISLKNEPEHSAIGSPGSFIGGKKGFLSGTARFISPTNSVSAATEVIDELYLSVANKSQHYRRIYLNLNHLLPANAPVQRSLFEKTERVSDKKIQSAILDIKSKYGKNAIFRAEDLEKSATELLRNTLIGGHNAS
ncbi:DNA repair protein [Candidatus Saccharibacteria bacterium]|nr:DNA repair protein [Candidatus Saccharibacteria bacterium]